MKVEQLKAELVVFKGLMSNVSRGPRGSLPLAPQCPVCHPSPMSPPSQGLALGHCLHSVDREATALSRSRRWVSRQ